tara:strand:- start:500 stop:1192 length:693 start_codon:yes stop_codon:yes gene_type:complete
MGIEKIILGDDHLDFAKDSMPMITGATVEYIDDPVKFIEMIKSSDQYDVVISDYDYGPDKLTGIDVFTYLEKEKIATGARKILWTGLSYVPEIRKEAEALGIEVLAKDELGSLVGMVTSKAPLKEGGSVLVYSGDDFMCRALDQVIKIPEVKVSSELGDELSSGKYGLVIDTSTVKTKSSKSGHATQYGQVAHYMMGLSLDEVPKVVCVYDFGKLVTDVLSISGDFLKKR